LPDFLEVAFLFLSVIREMFEPLTSSEEANIVGLQFYWHFSCWLHDLYALLGVFTF